MAVETESTTAEPLTAFVDARCGCKACTDRTEDTYRQVGYCSNCGARGILALYRSGDQVRDIDCPWCGCYHTVRGSNQRPATADEIPSAVSA